ncbi:MAG: thioredoxin domain-containing protein [Clostridia bacterium]|nr:thioredoxin domain-containing protein [Clostridia bacterium]
MNKNKLSTETSPYLKEHSTNPVNWYPWGNEAFAKAVEENKPILLSIGYSTCHWCHVMAKESFEDAEIATILNRSFVSIKVDREERPDIDSVYMEACKVLTGTGGWPLTVFLTPDKKPFFAGTYFPKQTKYGTIGFIELLLIIEKQWKNNREAVLNNAEVISCNIKTEEDNSVLEQDVIKIQYQYLKKSFDPNYGGFGNSPKFPMPCDLLFLAEYGKERKEPFALRMLDTTLDAMYLGGIFDHIGGGFSRYSTDNKWLIPHFEKMLYDNAQLINIYTEAYYYTGKEKFKNIADFITKWLVSEMRGIEGGFYSAQDADSNGIEGLYYLLDVEEVENVLGKERGKIFSDVYDITKEGNFEGKNIPNLLNLKKLLSENQILSDELTAIYNYRKNRMELKIDDKYLSFWNSLAVCSFANSFRRTLSQDYINLARNIFIFIQSRMTDERKVYSSYKDGKHSVCGVLDDEASYISACIALYGATFDEYYLKEAQTRVKQVINEFWDKKNCGFFFTPESGEKLIIRRKEVYDGVTPSGNSLMYENFVRLSKLSENPTQYEAMTENLEKYLDSQQSNGSRGYYCYAKLLKQKGNIIVCALPEEMPKDRFISNQRKKLFYYDNVIIKRASTTYKLINGQPTYYVCTNGTCLPPTNMI